MGVVPRVQSKLSRALHAHRGKKLLQDLPTQESSAMKRAIVRFRGAREKGAMAFAECLGVSQKDTMEDPLWRETLGRSLGSHDAAELVDGMCRGNGCRQETTRLHAISCTKTGWSSLSHNRVLHQALARSLRESKVQFVVEDTWPFRERASGQNSRLNPFTYGHHNGGGGTLRQPPSTQGASTRHCHRQPLRRDVSWQWLPARNHPPPRHILHKDGWSSLTRNQVLHQALARSLRESKAHVWLKIHGPSDRELANKTAD